MLPSFIPVPNVDDATLRKVQEAVQRVLRRVCICPILDGVLLRGLVFAAATPLPVIHKLGRMPLGFFVADITAAARIYHLVVADESTRITLQSDVACTAAIWIF